MMRSIELNFQEGGRPERWVDLQPGTKEARRKQGTWPGQILVRSAGGLAASFQGDWDNDQATAGTNKAYAAIQNFGGTTRPHVIKPRFKRALAFGGVVVRQVNHPGSRIPARRFMNLTDQDMQDMLDSAEDFINAAMPQGDAPT
jgi:phage gpG-like protein